jgi:hypothetical protein
MAKKTVASKLMDMFFQEGDYDPRYAMRKLDPIEGKPVVEQRQVIPENPITLEQLEGKPYLTTMSDRTAAGGVLTGFGDKQLGYPVNLTGGQDFMRDFTQNPNLWASGDTVVPKMVKAARELELEYGQPPVLMPWRMAPTGSDFAGMTGKTMLSYAAGNMPTTFKREVDGFMKLYVPNWKGVDNPASGAQFDALPDSARKQVQQQLDKLFRNKGGTTLPQSRLAIADQSQLNAPVGGFKNVGLIDTSQDALRGAGNPTYPSALAGDYLGTLDTNVTAIDLNPARYARARNPDGSFVEGPEGKDLLSTKTAPRRSMEVNYYGGLLDEPLLRDLEDRGFKVKSGVLPTLATLGVAAQGLLGSEEADAAIIPKLAQTTQRANTVPTAKAADAYLEKQGATGKSIDYGAGFGINAKAIDYDDTFEPFAEEGFTPTYANSADIPESTYGKLVSTNVLNVIPPDLRDDAVLSIGKILQPDGMAVIQTRSASAVNELKKSKTAIPQDEPASFLTSKGSYQKGFTRDELQGYVQGLLGDNFDVQKVPAKDIPNGSAISVKKLSQAAPLVVGGGLLAGEDAEAAIVPSALKSIALDAMAEVPRKTPTSYTGWKKALNKAGVKDDELKQMGFKREFEFRQRSQDITRKEVEDFLAAKQYNIREEVLGERKEFGEVVHDPELNTYNAEMPYMGDNQSFHTRAEAEAYVARKPEIMTDYEYGPYTLTGADGNNYREILLMDGPEADKYEALSEQIAAVEKELADVLGGGPDVVDYGDFSKFNRAQNAQREKLFPKLQNLRAEQSFLPHPFIHSHYDGKENILSHLRVADRDLEDGSSTLMVEEMQSDLHQRGQKQGYAAPDKAQQIFKQRDDVIDKIDAVEQFDVYTWGPKNEPELFARLEEPKVVNGLPENPLDVLEELEKKRDADYANLTGRKWVEHKQMLEADELRLFRAGSDAQMAVPDFPFKSDDKSSWYDLSFKRSLKEAADGDYDSISFTTGQQQVDRYGESAEGGVKTFYDKTLPNHINKWAKQYGAKLERKPIRVGERDYSVDTYDDGSYYVRNEEGATIEDFDSLEEAEAYIKDKHEIQDVYTLKIPEKMRKDIREKGMPLFAQTGLTIGGATAASGLLSPKAQANEARMQGLLSDSEMRQEVVKGAAVVPDLTAGLVEQFGRDLVNFTAGTINPDYGDIAEGSVFPVTEGGKATLSKAGEAFMKYAAPTLAKGVNSLLDFEPMIGPTARDQMKFVAQQYEKLPESVKEEVTPRLGYAGLLAMTAVPAGKAVKKTIKKRKKN